MVTFGLKFSYWIKIAEECIYKWIFFSILMGYLYTLIHVQKDNYSTIISWGLSMELKVNCVMVNDHISFMFMHYCLILSAFFILNGFFKREIFVLNVNIQAYFFPPSNLIFLLLSNLPLLAPSMVVTALSILVHMMHFSNKPN